MTMALIVSLELLTQSGLPAVGPKSGALVIVGGSVTPEIARRFVSLAGGQKYWFNDRVEFQNPGGPYGQVTRQTSAKRERMITTETQPCLCPALPTSVPSWIGPRRPCTPGS